MLVERIEIVAHHPSVGTSSCQVIQNGGNIIRHIIYFVHPVRRRFGMKNPQHHSNNLEIVILLHEILEQIHLQRIMVVVTIIQIGNTWKHSFFSKTIIRRIITDNIF